MPCCKIWLSINCQKKAVPGEWQPHVNLCPSGSSIILWHARKELEIIIFFPGCLVLLKVLLAEARVGSLFYAHDILMACCLSRGLGSGRKCSLGWNLLMCLAILGPPLHLGYRLLRFPSALGILCFLGRLFWARKYVNQMWKACVLESKVLGIDFWHLTPECHHFEMGKWAFHLRGGTQETSVCMSLGSGFHSISILCQPAWEWFFFFKRLSPKSILQKNNQVRLLFGCPRSAGTQKAKMDGSSTWLPLILLWRVSVPGIP